MPAHDGFIRIKDRRSRKLVKTLARYSILIQRFKRKLLEDQFCMSVDATSAGTPFRVSTKNKVVLEFFACLKMLKTKFNLILPNSHQFSAVLIE